MSIWRKMKRIGVIWALCVAAMSVSAQEEMPREFGCIEQSDVRPDHRPSELARVVRACISGMQYARAMQVYYTYSSFTLFDQQRVRDESGHVVLQELTPWIFSGYSRDVIDSLKEQADLLRGGDETFLSETCAMIRTIGWPTYRPTYMIDRALMPRKHAEDWTHDDFDPARAWERALTEVNNCPPA